MIALFTEPYKYALLSVLATFLLLSNNAYALSNDSVFESKMLQAKEAMTVSPDEAVQFLFEAEHIALDSKDKNQLGRVYWMIAQISERKGDVSNAIKYYYGAAAIYESLEDWRSTCYLYENIGTLHFDYKLTTQAVDAFRLALKYAVKKDDYALIAKINTDIGIAYRADNQFDSAIVNLMKARNLYTLNPNFDNWDELSKIYNEIGILFKKANSIANDKNYHKDAFAFYDTAYDYASTSIAKYRPLNNIGNLFLISSDTANAQRYLDSAFNIGKQAADYALIIPTLNNLGVIAYEKGEKSKADSLFRLAMESNLSKLKLREYNLIAKMELESNLFGELTKSMSYLDSLKSFSTADFVELKSSYLSFSLHQKQIENENMRQLYIFQDNLNRKQIEEKQYQEQLERLQERLIMGALISGLVVCVFLLFVRSRRKKSKLKASLDLVNNRYINQS